MAYLCEGIPESLIHNLSRIDFSSGPANSSLGRGPGQSEPRTGLRVLAWSTVSRLGNSESDVLKIGRELGVRAVFAGRLYKLGDNLVIKGELVDTADGSQIWGGQYQRRFDDIFAIEQAISSEICQQLKLRLNEEETQRLERPDTESAEAYQAYLQGRYYWNQRSSRGLTKAVESFQKAIALDPNYALAYTGLADCLAVLGVYGALPPRVVMPQARQSVMKALQLDDQLAEAHASLGAIHGWFDWDWAACERELRRAIELKPASALARHWYGSGYLTVMGRLEEGYAEQLRAHETEPLSLAINANLGWISYHAHDYDRAARHCLDTLEIDPNLGLAHFYLGLIYAQQRRASEAIDELKRSMEIAGRATLAAAALAYVYATMGRRAEGEGILEQLKSASPTGQVPAFFMAIFYAGLDEKDRAIESLNEAFDERYSWMAQLKTEPIFDGLRDDPKFDEILKRMNL